MQRSAFAVSLALLASCASAPPELVPSSPPLPATPVVVEPEPMAAMPPFRARLPVDSGAFYVPTSDPLHPRVHYAEGQDSLNDSCIVLTGNKLSRRVPPAFVNGRPIGFC